MAFETYLLRFVGVLKKECDPSQGSNYLSWRYRFNMRIRYTFADSEVAPTTSPRPKVVGWLGDVLLVVWIFTALQTISVSRLYANDELPQVAPRFTRHVTAVFSRLGCNGGTCHGAVQGKNGFRLSLFAGKPDEDYEQLLYGSRGRRINLAAPMASLLLRKPLGEMPHGGGKVFDTASPEFEILRRWIEAGAPRDSSSDSAIVNLTVIPVEETVPPGSSYQLAVTASFADGTSEDVTSLCSFASLDNVVATVDEFGAVTSRGVGDTALIVRYRAEPVMSMIVVPRQSPQPFPDVKPNNFIDARVLAKLKSLNLPPSDLCDDTTFLRRASLDLSGRLPTADEVRKFLAQTGPDKRAKKIDELLASDGHIALWTMKFCDLLKASDFGVYADAVDTKTDALRFQAWVRARLKENMPYDEFAARILTATSREGRSLSDWQKEVTDLFEGYNANRDDLDVYASRQTPDLYWQRKDATGVTGALQVAHAFLGLRLECARCHRHPHDVWQQDDLLNFANFFMRLRGAGFNGENEKRYPEVAKVYADLQGQAKKLEEEAKKLGGEANQLRQETDKLKQDTRRLAGEIADLQARAKQLGSQEKPDEASQVEQQISAKQEQLDKLESELQQKQRRATEIVEIGRRGKYLVEVGRRMMHAEITHRGKQAEDQFATVASPLGTQTSKTFRLLGESQPVDVTVDEDPRDRVAAWIRRPDNPFFARAIVNRVWSHYFGRGIVDPPDNLSPLNPATHPELLADLASKFIESGYDLRWLHRQIVTSRTYQQSSAPTSANRTDRANYAYFYLRRLDAEVILDALDAVTGSREDFRMQYWKWPDDLRAIEIPYPPEQNEFVSFMLEHFGRPQRNSAIQCDCERITDASILQILSMANHPRVWEKISDPAGRAASIAAQTTDDEARVEEIFLATVSRFPTKAEMAASLEYLGSSASTEQGVQGLMWSLLNTKEFLLQH